jgi:hypothetical protein
VQRVGRRKKVKQPERRERRHPKERKLVARGRRRKGTRRHPKKKAVGLRAAVVAEDS